MLCCCCWPPRLCAISLSMVDTSFVALLFYRTVDRLCAIFDHIDGVDALIFVVLLGLLICEILAAITLLLSDKRGISRYVWPRFTLLICQFTTAFVVCLFLLFYFSGYSESINNAFISGYEASQCHAEICPECSFSPNAQAYIVIVVAILVLIRLAFPFYNYTDGRNTNASTLYPPLTVALPLVAYRGEDKQMVAR
ncbi:unnamed protein product [Toxocara canis]|uniref:Lysosomal protein transmembrane 5 n=1 Tax=Toxocara canis TaxID=6265 RepID=A0A183U2I3_TOXCA|nr:unnamed protein product [Toxocara canis]